MVRHPLPAGLRRAMGVILIAGLCVLAVTVFQEAPGFPRSTSTAESSTPLPAATMSGSGAPSTLPSPTSSASATPPTSLKPAKLPKGPGTTEPGILLMASPLPTGDFDIAEMVRLATPTSSVRLSPPKLALAGGRFAKAKPAASQVQLSAEDQPVLVPGGRVDRATDIALNSPAKRMELRYTLRGITVRSMPSRAGRSLTAISPLAGGFRNDLPVAMMVSGSTLLNIQCPVLRLNKQTCWVGQLPHLRVKPQLPLNRAVIIVQFDLPKPQ